jgi:hypothetical protein
MTFPWWDDLADDELRARLANRLLDAGHSRPHEYAAWLVANRDEFHAGERITEVLA